MIACRYANYYDKNPKDAVLVKQYKTDLESFYHLNFKQQRCRQRDILSMSLYHARIRHGRANLVRIKNDLVMVNLHLFCSLRCFSLLQNRPNCYVYHQLLSIFVNTSNTSINRFLYHHDTYHHVQYTRILYHTSFQGCNV